jgi:DNA-binding response OmpR family regulator
MQPMGNSKSPVQNLTPRILLVEDSDDLRTLMVLVLQSEGYVVDAVPTAPEGLAWLSSVSYDMVLSDYALPGHSGAWMLREAVERRLVDPQRALIITAHPNPADTAGFEVVRKPLDFESFLRHIRELLADRDGERDDPCVGR